MKIAAFTLKVIEAARKLDRKLYKPFYHKWHEPVNLDDGRHQCYVCFAGAWVAANPKSDSHQSYHPYVGRENPVPCKQMHALEYIRRCNWRTAAQVLQADNIPNYGDYPLFSRSKWAGFVNWEQFDKFLKHVEAQAEELQAKGY